MKAKLCFLSSISTSQDPLIQEILSILNDDNYTKSQRIPPRSTELLLKAKSSISTITSKTLNSQCRREFRERLVKTHGDRLMGLSVQTKILSVAELEDVNKVWKRVLQGLPAGQLSFLLRAGTDTLPTPLNLRRWRLKMDPRCPLCGNRQPTIHHILSNCSEALQQGRYTWRHDCALKVLARGIKDHLDPDTVLYADLPGMRTSENPPATIPDNILITPARPDIVMVAQSDVTLIELTIPHNLLESISRARQRKSEKEVYQLVLSDLEAKGLTSNLYTIEIGSLQRSK